MIRLPTFFIIIISTLCPIPLLLSGCIPANTIIFCDLNGVLIEKDKENAEKRKIIQSTVTILNYLKSNGYKIIFTTNKSRHSYQQTAEQLGNALTDLADHVIVADKRRKSTKTIFVVSEKKPAREYYQCALNVVDQLYGNDITTVIFIDNKKINTQGFKALRGETNKNLYAITFDQEDPQHLIDKLIKYGILPKNDDVFFSQFAIHL